MIRRTIQSSRHWRISPTPSGSTSHLRSIHVSSSTQSPKPTHNPQSWAATTESAHSVLDLPPQSSNLDPIEAITLEIKSLKSSLFHLLGNSHPSLDTIAKYYFQADGKHLRPLLVLLMSQATNGLGGKGWEEAVREASVGDGVDDALTNRGGVLNDWNPESMGPEPNSMVFSKPFQLPDPLSSPPPPTPTKPSYPPSTSSTLSILPTQRRLASITEMIHVASLLHDDVIDTSDLRRGLPSAPSAFGNKLSILSGDFLLGRASVALARLGSREVVELLATVIANLVEGEVMQLKATAEPEDGPSDKGFEEYMRKTYLKTASLMAKSARAAVILGGCGGKEAEWVKDVAYGYGRNLGIAFQLVDDMLDYLPPSPTLGKPASADLQLGLATAPALFAWQTHPSLGPLIKRKFSEPGDVEIAKDLVGRSDGLEQTRQLAERFAGEARGLVELLPDSPARKALVDLTWKVVDRVK